MSEYFVWYRTHGQERGKQYLRYVPDGCSFYTSLEHATGFKTVDEAQIHVPVYDGNVNIESRTGVIHVDREFKRLDISMVSLPGWRSKEGRLPLVPTLWIVFSIITLSMLWLTIGFLLLIYGYQWWGGFFCRAPIGTVLAGIFVYAWGRLLP